MTDNYIPIKPDITDDVVQSLILKKTLTDNTYLNLLMEDFDKRWFSNSNIRLLLNLTIKHAKKYDKVPNKALLSAYIDKLSEKSPELIENKASILEEYNEAMSLDIAQNCENDSLFVEKQILSYIREKSLYFAIMDNIDRIETKKDPTNCIKSFEKALGLTLYKDIGADYLENISTHFDELQSKESKIPIGIPCLDRGMNGGISADGDCLFVFMAQPCLGKSLMLSNSAFSLLDSNGFAVIITLELSEKMYQRRFSAHISGDNIDTLQATREESEKKIKKYAVTHPGAKLVIKRFPENSITTMNLENYLDRLIKEMNRTPDIIYIDYLNLMLPKNKTYNSTMYERVGDVARDLRSLSLKYKRPVVTATQLNASGFNTGSVGLENTSESKIVAHTADVMISLTQEEDDIDAGIINAQFLKNRYGKNHIRNRLAIDYENLKITDFDVNSTCPTGSCPTSPKPVASKTSGDVDDFDDLF
jgi:hypothetical protein